MQRVPQANAYGHCNRDHQHPIISSAQKMTNQCPFCLSEDSLQEQTYQFSAHPMPGYSVQLQLQSQICSFCHEQIESPLLVSQNNAAISNAKLEWLASNVERDKAIGYLVKELRANLGVTQRRFSEITGATGISISKYELHTIKPSALATTLFLVLAKSPEARETLKFQWRSREARININQINAAVISINDRIMGLNYGEFSLMPTTASSAYTSIIDFDNEFSEAPPVVELESIGNLSMRQAPHSPVATSRSTLLIETVH